MLCTCLPPPRSATLSSSGVLSPASCPKAGDEGGRVRGGRYRISPANGTVPKGFGSLVNIPHSIPLPHLQAHAEPSRPGKPTGYRTTAPNSQTHSQAPDTCTGKILQLAVPGCTPHVHVHERQRGDPETPPPTICRWCQRLQSAIRFKFMINRYFAQTMKSFPISPTKSFTLYKQSRWK